MYRVDFEYVMLSKSLGDVTKHFEDRHAAFTYNPPKRLYKMADSNLSPRAVLLAGKASSDQNIAEVSCAATKTIVNKEP
jgi:hypothetical protein